MLQVLRLMCLPGGCSTGTFCLQLFLLIALLLWNPYQDSVTSYSLENVHSISLVVLQLANLTNIFVHLTTQADSTWVSNFFVDLHDFEYDCMQIAWLHVQTETLSE